jgi:hypothetical protein
LKDFLTVGRKPKASIIVIKIIEVRGLLVSSQGMSANTAEIKHTQSNGLIDFSPFLRARKNIRSITIAVKPTDH